MRPSPSPFVETLLAQTKLIGGILYRFGSSRLDMLLNGFMTKMYFRFVLPLMKDVVCSERLIRGLSGWVLCSYESYHHHYQHLVDILHLHVEPDRWCQWWHSRHRCLQCQPYNVYESPKLCMGSQDMWVCVFCFMDSIGAFAEVMFAITLLVICYRTLGIPTSVLPEIRSNSEVYGSISSGALKGVPISGVCKLMFWINNPLFPI